MASRIVAKQQRHTQNGQERDAATETGPETARPGAQHTRRRMRPAALGDNRDEQDREKRKRAGGWGTIQQVNR